MPSSQLAEVLALLPQALARVDAELRLTWLEASFNEKTGLVAEVGQSLLDLIEAAPGRDALALAIGSGEARAVEVTTCALKQARVQVHPSDEGAGSAWLLFENSGLDDEMAFAQALQEIARAIGDTLDVDAVCAAAVMALVRCAHVWRAEAYLVDEARQLRRVATSDAGEPGHASVELLVPGSLKHALATGQPEIGVARGKGEGDGSIFAAIPLFAQRRTVGLLVLYKEKGASFSVRELDLWSAAAGQLAVAVENARLLREAQSALQVRDEFMSIASHELKTPLTPLKLGLYTMERKLMMGQGIELGSIVKAQRQIDRLAGLVNDLLDASRLELGKLSIARAPIELGQLLIECVDQFRVAVDREFHLAMPNERLWVWGDRDRLEQVLVNLIDNANKYSPAGVPVTLEVDRVRDDLCVHVADRGIGIPGADQAQIFQRFYRARNANRNFAGLGLGLFISHAIVKLHGGALSLVSDEGRGSRFTVRLPRMSARDVKALPRRVLVVDPDRAHEAEASSVLRQAGFDVVCARDEGDALRKLAHLPFDAVVMSAELPRAELMIRTARTLQLVRPLPFVVSGEVAPEWAKPPLAYVRKPYVSSHLADAVREGLARSEGVNPSYAHA